MQHKNFNFTFIFFSHARVQIAPYDDEPIIEASSHTQITGLVGNSMEKKSAIKSKINVEPANW